MDTNLILEYLSALRENNSREWFHAHKADYRQAAAQFEALLQDLILRLGETDPEILRWAPGDLTFKLVRDTRFSHDKSPYLPAFRAHLSPRGKLPVPVGYYVMIKPGDQSFLGGGLFADMFKDATAMVRDRIAAHPEEWAEIIRTPAFASRFQVRGTALKNVPAGYDKAHPQAEFLKYKSWYVEYPVADGVIRDSAAFPELAMEVFQAMRPFNGYLNQALAGFHMPER